MLNTRWNNSDDDKIIIESKYYIIRMKKNSIGQVIKKNDDQIYRITTN